MYCPHCGNETTGELNYCKRCGGSLNPPALQPSRPVAPATVWAMGITTALLIVMSLGLLFDAVDKLADRAIPPVLVLMVIFGSLTILGGATLLVWLWTRVLGSARSTAPPTQLGAHSTAGLPPARPASLQDAVHFPSVTEHTTRTFDNIRRER